MTAQIESNAVPDARGRSIQLIRLVKFHGPVTDLTAAKGRCPKIGHGAEVVHNN